MAKKQKPKPRSSKTATSKRPARSRRRDVIAKVLGWAKSAGTAPATVSPDSANVAREEKYVVLNLERDPGLDYYVRTSGRGGKDGGDVWATPSPKPGAPKLAPVRVTSVGFHVDWDKFNYFVDADGDVSRTPRRWKRKESE